MTISDGYEFLQDLRRDLLNLTDFAETKDMGHAVKEGYITEELRDLQRNVTASLEIDCLVWINRKKWFGSLNRTVFGWKSWIYRQKHVSFFWSVHSLGLTHGFLHEVARNHRLLLAAQLQDFSRLIFDKFRNEPELRPRSLISKPLQLVY